ncbi:ALBINO3-like protein 1, chloroplastic isoform X2 [Oryza sativa Japonica Group]|uniref:ARTEMIS protein, chloroplast, putative, expressed n=2 Tax=Oryza sativa subsp. japonica TaxID=39947 RepID=Q75LC5_ORYSJ|nr:ALBINO3-like protein 1, chloroplastic isoform X2 [Oryza sativa Japonica Group]AAS07376.1 putative inner membrane protein (with alternative splicing) [Oryza sativa Japonica Group]ABF99855.1 ARTEMIS protein, chloroplast precursor, putative, expressed [Oryza sativa Japonica Group]
MDAHLLLLARPRALALAAARAPGGVAGFRRPASARRVAPRRVVLRPVAALGGGGGFAEVGELFGRVEAFLYTVADAAVSASPEVVQGGGGGTKEAAGDWLSGITNSMETVLKVLKDGLSALHVPYPYGFAIILLTVLVKAATFPLTKKQVESAIAMRSLQPQVKAIQERYAGDQERIQLETARLYKLSDVDPLAGCLPTLVTIPVWIGLYRALSNVANEGLLTEGFFWIPSLAGPTTIAARQSGQGISWLFPFTDGHPPLGWSDTLAYLVLPVLLVISQYVSSQVMQPPQNNDPSQQGAQAVVKFLPLLIGYFALSVPSGLSLYWLTNNILSTAQQVWLQKLGGAKNPVKEYIDKLAKEESTNLGKPEPAIKSDPLPKVGKPPASQEPEPSGPQRGERFRKLKEEESRRKVFLEKAEQTEQAGTQAGIVDGKQNSDASGDNIDEQESHENEPIIANGNGGLSHSTNEMIPNGSMKEVCFVLIKATNIFK